MKRNTRGRPVNARFFMPRLAGLLCLLPAFCTAWTYAQNPSDNVNYLLDARQPPGYVASWQVARGARGVGSYQAVSVSGPAGLKVGLAQAGQFLEPIDAPVTTAMLVGAVYRLRVTNIPFQPGQELYPTVEIIDRIYAPDGREHRFPIPVVLTSEDLTTALNGGLVTRVIYLEDSEIAEPIAAAPDTQRVLDVGPLDNALQTADQLGRPVAILRIGSRVPASLEGDLGGFLFGSPPWLPLMPVPDRERLIAEGHWAEMPPVERTNELYRETPIQDEPRTPISP